MIDSALIRRVESSQRGGGELTKRGGELGAGKKARKWQRKIQVGISRKRETGITPMNVLNLSYSCRSDQTNSKTGLFSFLDEPEFKLNPK